MKLRVYLDKTATINGQFVNSVVINNLEAIESILKIGPEIKEVVKLQGWIYELPKPGKKWKPSATKKINLILNKNKIYIDNEQS